MALAWHCVFTKSAAEESAASEIRAKGFPSYYPEYTRQRVHNHRVEHVQSPLFPRYIFAEFNRELPGWQTIKSNSRYVFDILKDGLGRPLRVPLSAIQAMQSHSPTDPTETGRQTFSPGQAVRLVDGAFSGFEGLFQEDAAGRVTVLLELFGRKTQTVVDRSVVQAIS